MPTSNEEFIKKAFEAGLTEDQVRAAVAERNQRKASTTTPTTQKPNALLSGIGRVLNIGSNVFGGQAKVGGEMARGTYQAPQIANIPLTKIGGKRDVDLGELILPNIVGVVRGLKENQTLMEETPKAVGVDPNTGAGLAVGLASELVAPDPLDALALIKGADKAIKINPLLKTNTEAVQAAEKIGIDLPLSAKTDNQFIRTIEAGAQKTLFGGKTRQKIVKAFDDVEKAYSDLTSKTVKENNFVELGENLKKGFDGFVSNFQKGKRKLYESVPDEIKKVSIVPTQTANTVTSILERKANTLVKDPSTGFYKELSSKLGIGKKNPKPPTYEQLKETLRFVGQKVNNFADAVAVGEKGNLERLYASISQDLNETLKATAPELYEASRKADKFYEKGINQIKGDFGKLIQNKNPEDVFKFLSKPGSETAIKEMKGIVGDKAFQQFQEGVLQQIFNKSVKRTASNPDGVLDLTKFSSEIGKYGDDALRRFLSPDQLKRLGEIRSQLKNLSTVEKSLKAGTKTAEGSQTAFNLLNMGAVTASALNPINALNYIIGSMGVNKALESQALEKLLLKGGSIPKAVVNAPLRATQGTGLVLDEVSKLLGVLGSGQDQRR